MEAAWLPNWFQNNNTHYQCEANVERRNFQHLDEAGVPIYFVGVTDQFELLHDSHRLVQVQDDSCGCNTEISLQRQSEPLRTAENCCRMRVKSTSSTNQPVTSSLRSITQIWISHMLMPNEPGRVRPYIVKKKNHLSSCYCLHSQEASSLRRDRTLNRTRGEKWPSNRHYFRTLLFQYNFSV